MSSVNKAMELISAHRNCSSGESDGFRYFKFFLQLCYLIPCGAVYIAFMASILKKRKHRHIFEDTFFTLCLVDGCVTVLFLLLDICFSRLTTYVHPLCEFLVPILSSPAYYLTPYLTLYCYLQFAKMLCTLTMSINRYTSVNFPVRHKTVWMQHYSKAIAAVLLIPIIFTWPVAIARTNFAPFHGQSLVVYEHKLSWARTTYGRILIGGTTLVFTVYSSIITTAKLSKLGKHMRKVEVSINIATVLVSAGFVLHLILQVSFLTINAKAVESSPTIIMFIFAFALFVNDFYMLSGPVVLLILDKRIRSSIFSCFRHRPNKKHVNEVSVRPVTCTEAKFHVCLTPLELHTNQNHVF